MSHLTNAQIFKAIGLDDSVKPMPKYTLLICAHVLMDWKTWSGQISADQIALASHQSSRQVKRHLKSLVEAGWLTRHAEVRGPGLHHKSSTFLNQDKVRLILERSHDVTEKVSPDVTDLVSAQNVTTTVTEKVSHDVTERVNTLPKMSHISISLNNSNQYKSIEVEPKPEARVKRGLLEDGFEWCERCKRHVSMDEPHTYPHSKLICSDEEPTPEQVKAMEWDQAWGVHQEQVTKPEPKAMIERREGNLYFIDEIHDELDYKRQVLKVVGQPDTQLIRDALWTRQGDHLYQQMKDELIAPRSAIDWVMIQAGREVTEPTPPPPPEPSKVRTVSVEEQIRIRQIDQAWLTSGQTNNGDSNTW